MRAMGIHRCAIASKYLSQFISTLLPLSLLSPGLCRLSLPVSGVSTAEPPSDRDRQLGMRRIPGRSGLEEYHSMDCSQYGT